MTHWLSYPIGETICAISVTLLLVVIAAWANERRAIRRRKRLAREAWALDAAEFVFNVRSTLGACDAARALELLDRHKHLMLEE